MTDYAGLAEDLRAAHNSGDHDALRRLTEYTGMPFTQELVRSEVRQKLGRTEEAELSLEDSRWLIARVHEFEDWPSLTEIRASLPPGTEITRRPVKLQDAGDRPIQVRDWDTAFRLIQERGIPRLEANGQMTDALLQRVRDLDSITSLDLSESRQVTDAGLRLLPRLPRLERLNLSGCSITDEGLGVLRDLPQLKALQITWNARVTDRGAAHLQACEAIERVDLMGTATGDGTIAALAGKRNLRHLKTGEAVTGAGLAMLHDLPVFKTWQGGETSMALLGFEAEPNYLLLRGSFTDHDVSKLVGLDGLFALNLDDRKLAITSASLDSIAQLPRLGWLAFDAGDDSMPRIAAMPGLRFLMCQDTVASDDGFVSLSRSQSIEYIWGRRCHNLTERGFVSLAQMPALRGLSVSCKNVNDSGVAALPSFPSLKELMPMDVPDEGYRHIGRCEQLESLVLMYCRDTTDVSTSHLANLPVLRSYVASYNRITDRSLEILGGIDSLERVELTQCVGVTDAGVAALARLPRLKEVGLFSLPRVTGAGAAVFPVTVRVGYAP